MKLVINDCYGGFSLSDDAMRRIAEIKGLTLYPEVDTRFNIVTYWLVPEGEREDQDNFYRVSPEERRASNERYSSQVLGTRGWGRNDPALVQAVEELGEKAGGRCARLKVVEIPDDVEYTIEEYDGIEHVAEVHRTWS